MRILIESNGVINIKEMVFPTWGHLGSRLDSMLVDKNIYILTANLKTNICRQLFREFIT